MGKDFIKTYEYKTMVGMQENLVDFISYAIEETTRIELSIIEQDEFGENINCWTFCEIDLTEYRKGIKNYGKFRNQNYT
jgi:hypothetical protein